MQPFFSPIQAGSFAFGATLERLWFRRRTFHVPNLMQNYFNVFVSILTEFSPFELSSAAIKIGVWISSAGLSNLGRPQFELSSAHEKFGVWTGPNFYSQTVHWLRVNSVWNYPLRWAYLNVMKCWRSPRKVKSSSFLSARQIAQKESFQSTFPPKTHRNTHEEGKRWETYLAFELGFRAFMCAVLWCGSGDLGIEVAQGNQPLFASCWKTTLNKQRTSKP